MINNLRLLSLFIILISGNGCGSQKKLDCPIPSGTILIKTERGAELAKPTRFVFVSGGREVYSSTNGVVKFVLKENSKVHCSIKTGKYTLGYGNLSECLIKEGESIKKGHLLGYLKEGENLEMYIMEKNNYLQPEQLLRCPTMGNR